MNIIDVKGTRTKPTQADAAQRYVLRADRKSKAPLAIGAIIASIAVYLQSFFTSSVSAEQGGAAPDEDDPAGQAEPQLAMADVLPISGGGMASAPGGATGLPYTGSGGTLVDPQTPGKFLTLLAPDIGLFLHPEVPLRWEALLNAPYVVRSANDNIASVPMSGTTEEIATTADEAPDEEVGEPVDAGSEEGAPEAAGSAESMDDSSEIIEPDVADTDQPDPDDADPEATEPEDDDEDEEPSEAQNRAPRVTGPVYLMDVTGCAILTIGLTDLLQNALDPDGDLLSVIQITASTGILTQAEGGWTFQDAGSLGPVTITYQITDGEFTVEQVAQFSVVASALLEGSNGNDTLIGSACADDIDGREGDDDIDADAGSDTISGGDGNDLIVAGAGNDTVFGGRGDDTIFGDDGDDQLSGGEGDDHISGGSGNDTLFGDDGNDVLFGDGGNDVLIGGSGDDSLIGGEGDDAILGGEANDLIDGGAGNDMMDGGAGDDTILDGDGRDMVLGGQGNDSIVAALDQDDDVYDGGEGHDRIDYSAARQDVVIDLAEGMAAGSETGTDTVTGFEAAVGGSGDDEITGSADANILEGSDGDDTIDGGAGIDHIDGGNGNDRLIDGEGEDTVLGGSGEDVVSAALDGDDDVFEGGEGSDTLDYSATTSGIVVDLLDGSAIGVEIGADTVRGFEVLLGGSGNDHVTAGNEAVSMAGAAGQDIFEFISPAATPGHVSSASHQIIDFEVGDRIRMSKYDIFDRVIDELEDHFGEVYGEEVNEDEVPIRYRHDRFDELDRTVIEADLNNDDSYETSIYLSGHHALIIVEHP